MTPHLEDQCLEVLLPLLKTVRPDIRIVPIAVSEEDPDKLHLAGLGLAKVIKHRILEGKEAPMLIVSSDMNHYLSQEETCIKDELALEAILAIDGKALYSQVLKKNISMCGVLPATVALQACRDLGASNAILVKHATSGEVNGDWKHVVGYAGVVIS